MPTTHSGGTVDGPRAVTLNFSGPALKTHSETGNYWMGCPTEAFTEQG